MLEKLDCPNCGAPLTAPAIGAETMQCPYCHTTVLLSGVVLSGGPRGANSRGALRGPAKPVVTKSRVGPGLAVSLVVLAGVLIAAVFLAASGHGNSTAASSASVPGKPAFANMVLEFGSKGITPGHFEDARCISVDHLGHIYVADAKHGRVQVFDGSGKYLSEFSVGSFDELVADRNGTVYVATGGKIIRFNGPTGARLPDIEGETMDGPGAADVHADAHSDPALLSPNGLKTSIYYRGICQTPGALYAIIGTGVDSPCFVKLNTATGRVASIVRATAPPQERLDLREILALTTGEIFGLDTEMGIVFKFTSEGAYVNKFGGAVEDSDPSDPPPSQLRWPSGMASDSQGRIYISNASGIKVYDKAGNYIGGFADPHFPSGIAIDEQDNIYACFQDCVRKYVLQKR